MSLILIALLAAVLYLAYRHVKTKGELQGLLDEAHDRIDDLVDYVEEHPPKLK